MIIKQLITDQFFHFPNNQKCKCFSNVQPLIQNQYKIYQRFELVSVKERERERERREK